MKVPTLTKQKIIDAMTSLDNPPPGCRWPKVVGNPILVVARQIRFPRSKKKRIRKKWSRDPRNIVYDPDPMCYVVGNTILAHPSVAQILREQIPQARGGLYDYL